LTPTEMRPRSFRARSNIGASANEIQGCTGVGDERRKTSSATRSFSSANVPISWPQSLQLTMHKSLCASSSVKWFFPHAAQASSMRMCVELP
jgi:hypothetical protein